MIVYESNLGQFINNCQPANHPIIGSLIIDKMDKLNMGVSQSEIDSWNSSLPKVASALDDDSLDKNISIAIEYKFETSKNRIDLLVYGKDDNDKNSMVIVELKQWSHDVSFSNKKYYVKTFGPRGDYDYFHPSYQSFRYKKILEGFYKYIQIDKTNVQSCSYLHDMDNVNSIVLKDSNAYPFISDSPIFLHDDVLKLREFIKKYVKKGNRELLYQIDANGIRPSKEFSNMLYSAIAGNDIFSLDDNQAESVSQIVNSTNYAVGNNLRTTIIIKGGPGTGKSLVAINAMGQLIHPTVGNPKNVCYCTANFTPRELFGQLLVNNDYTKAAIKNLFKTEAAFARCSEFDFDCILVDEAHRAFEWKFGQGVSRSVDMIDRIFYASKVQVFFIDEDQIVTKDDYLTIEKIKQYAKKYNSTVIDKDDLKLSSQFRCMGGERYLTFLSHLLGYNGLTPIKYKPSNYELKVFNTASELWQAIQEKQHLNDHVDIHTRLLAGYTHEYLSKNDPNAIDFDFDNHKFQMRWNKYNNPVVFIEDGEQLDRIGSISTIQGVDMNYAGVIIGKDVLFRNGKIVFDKRANASSDSYSGIRTADDDRAELMIRNTYKVLLSRAIYGTYIYCEDKELNEFIKSLIVEE